MRGGGGEGGSSRCCRHPPHPCLPCSLPLPLCAEVWRGFFAGGWPFAFRVVLALLAHLRPHLRLRGGKGRGGAAPHAHAEGGAQQPQPLPPLDFSGTVTVLKGYQNHRLGIEGDAIEDVGAEDEAGGSMTPAAVGLLALHQIEGHATAAASAALELGRTAVVHVRERRGGGGGGSCRARPVILNFCVIYTAALPSPPCLCSWTSRCGGTAAPGPLRHLTARGSFSPLPLRRPQCRRAPGPSQPLQLLPPSLQSLLLRLLQSLLLRSPLRMRLRPPLVSLPRAKATPPLLPPPLPSCAP